MPLAPHPSPFTPVVTCSYPATQGRSSGEGVEIRRARGTAVIKANIRIFLSRLFSASRRWQHERTPLAYQKRKDPSTTRVNTCSGRLPAHPRGSPQKGTVRRDSRATGTPFRRHRPSAGCPCLPVVSLGLLLAFDPRGHGVFLDALGATFGQLAWLYRDENNGGGEPMKPGTFLCGGGGVRLTSRTATQERSVL